jgi:hypothetical protein
MKAIRMDITPNRTYKTPENVEKAIEKILPKLMDNGKNLRYFIHVNEEGRFFPVFVGTHALHSGVHFHFNVIG